VTAETRVAQDLELETGMGGNPDQGTDTNLDQNLSPARVPKEEGFQ